MKRPKSIDDVNAHVTEDGWERIGAVCSAGRRSIWMRLTFEESAPLAGLYDDAGAVTQIELRGGREGDDDYLVITRDNPQFGELLDFFCTARFAVQT
jgi:hypothetical protein